MAIDLKNIKKNNEVPPLIFTVAGAPGVGKTTLACSFPRPILIMTEDGSRAVKDMPGVTVYPVLCDTFNKLVAALEQILNDDHDFYTLVIDSVTQENVIIESEVVQSDARVTSINNALGGYGAGQSAVAEKHRKIRELCNKIYYKRRMNIGFCAHTEIETITPPDGEAYTSYQLRMNKKSFVHYIDNVDVVAFIKLESIATKAGKNDDRKILTATNARILSCKVSLAHPSKNRLGIDEDIQLDKGENPFEVFLPEWQLKPLQSEVKTKTKVKA